MALAGNGISWAQVVKKPKVGSGSVSHILVALTATSQFIPGAGGIHLPMEGTRPQKIENVPDELIREYYIRKSRKTVSKK